MAELGGAVLLHACGYQRDADLGGCWDYIQSWTRDKNIRPIDACMQVVNRTCQAVALILQTAEQLAQPEIDTAMSARGAA